MDIKEKKSRTTLSKQKSFIVVLAATATILASLYFFVFPNLSFFKEAENKVPKYSEYGDEIVVDVYDKTQGKYITSDLKKMLSQNMKNTYDVKPGEEENIAYTFRKDNVEIEIRPFIFKEIPLDEVSKVIVSNESGTFTVYQSSGNFFVEGAEKNLYNSSALSTLVLNARYMLSNGYVESEASLESFGLEEGNEKATVTIVDKSGNSNVVHVGNQTDNGKYYYAKHADKDMIYLMTSFDVFMNDKNSLLNPIVVRTLETQQRNYLDSFTLTKNEKEFLSCVRIPDEERVGVYVNQLHKLVYPQPEHVLNTTTLYDMFEMSGGLSGTYVVETGVSEMENKDEVLQNYGLLQPSARVDYSYNGNSYSFSVGYANEYGEYYVYSPYQDTIVTVSASELAFLNYDIIDFYQNNVFQYSIDFVSEIEVIHGESSVTYVLNDTGKALTVKEKNSGKNIDVSSFRQFYISLLNVTIGGYSTIGGDEAKELKHELGFNVKLHTGEKMIYEFYSESPVSCYMIADGNGGFKTDRRYIDDIVEKSDMLMNGVTIESQF